MTIQAVCPVCKQPNEVGEEYAGAVVVCFFCDSSLPVPVPRAPLVNTLTSSSAPPGPPVHREEICSDMIAAKAEMRRVQAPPLLVDRGPVKTKKPMRRIRTSLGIHDDTLADFAIGGIIGVGVAAAAATYDESDGWGGAALAAVGLAAADVAFEPQHDTRRQRPDAPSLVDFRRFVQGRRVDRHGEQLVTIRMAAGSFTPEAEEDLRTAVRLAVYLVLCLMDDDNGTARSTWSELAKRFDVEPAYDLVFDLLVETDLVSTTLLGSVLRRWFHAAKWTKRVPADMEPKEQRNRRSRRR